jgi:hypothetical protein
LAGLYRRLEFVQQHGCNLAAVYFYESLEKMYGPTEVSNAEQFYLCLKCLLSAGRPGVDLGSILAYLQGLDLLEKAQETLIVAEVPWAVYTLPLYPEGRSSFSAAYLTLTTGW